MARLIALLGILLVAALPFVEDVLAQPKPVAKGKKYAILIGVNQYSKPGYEELKFAERDMTRLKEALEIGGFKVTLLLGSEKADGEATIENIRKVLLDKQTSVLKTLGQADTVLVAFSGHGEQIPVKQGDKEVEVPFFCPKHAVSGDPDTQISINDVLETLDQRGAGSNLVLVDACRKFTKRIEGKKSGASMDRSKVNTLRDGIGVMFACSDRQEAMEHPKAGDGHGLFFYSVLEALKSTERNKRGEITWEQLVPQIRTKVKDLADELDTTTPEERRQRPQYMGNFTRDPVLMASTAVFSTERKGGDEVEFNIADGVKMRFCWIPPGEAQLGSPKAEREAVMKVWGDEEENFTLKAEAEGVRGKYVEKKGFWLGKYPVTQQEWTAVMGTTPFMHHKDGIGKESVTGLDTSRFPADRVSFDEIYGKGWKDGDAPLAGSFLAKLNARPGVEKVFDKAGKFRLPHEDRWEYAYRGGQGNKRAYYWGDEITKKEANYGENVGRPTVVGEYESAAPHPWKLCDMSGNVAQWCENKHHYSEIDYTGLEHARVLRGGTHYYNSTACRAANRSGAKADGGNGGGPGFRVCMILD